MKLLHIIILAFLFSSCQDKSNLNESIQSLIALDSISKTNLKYDSLIQPYKYQLDSAMNRIIGFAPKTLSNHTKRGETTLGNFVSDLILYQSHKLNNDSVDLALINTHGGLRVPISEGEIKVGDIYELMPFDNEILILELSGEDVHQIFEHTANDCRNSISPTTFEIVNGKSRNIKINGQTIDYTKTYRLAISDYLANGGGGFDFLQSKPRKALGIKLRDMIIAHIEELTQQEKSIESTLEGRIIMNNDVQ